MNRHIALLIITIIMALSLPIQALAADSDYVIEKGERVPIPLTYEPVKVMLNLGPDKGYLNKPQDIFIDKNDTVYVADTENNRVLKLDSDGQAVGVFTGPPDKPLRKPQGVFVDADGDIYVADTGNGRIVHLAPDGKVVEEFNKPESSMVSDLSFDPTKVYINPTGYIYVLNQSNYQGFMMLDAYNNFRGYLGSTKVGFSIGQWLLRSFGTEEQRARVADVTAPPYSNFVIDDDGIVYACVLNATQNHIVKLNSVGANIYAAGKGLAFTDVLDVPESTAQTQSQSAIPGTAPTAAANVPTGPNFVDLAVDENGIISVLERTSSKVYQYDQDGNLLTAFGGKGNWKGRFQRPSSIAADSAGNLYVLDEELGVIQVFKPTHFIDLVHQAVKLYSDGEYDKAKDVWAEVLKIDANYELAHRGIAKALYKQGQWQEAMDEYLKGNDRAGYSQAFAEYRHEMFRANFGWLILAIIAIIAASFLIISRIKAVADKAWKKVTTWEEV